MFLSTFSYTIIQQYKLVRLLPGDSFFEVFSPIAAQNCNELGLQQLIGVVARNYLVVIIEFVSVQ